jgi:hypothetical protein
MQNWKTTLSGIGAALMSLLGAIAALPYSLGDVSTLIAPQWKARIAVASFIAAFVLKAINSTVQKDANPKP